MHWHKRFPSPPSDIHTKTQISGTLCIVHAIDKEEKTFIHLLLSTANRLDLYALYVLSMLCQLLTIELIVQSSGSGAQLIIVLPCV